MTGGHISIMKSIQNIANVFTGRNSAQCRVGTANYNESKTIKKAACFVVIPSFTLYSDHQTIECSTNLDIIVRSLSRTFSCLMIAA